MPATIQDVVKRLTVVHTTPGAENASRRIRDVGSAMREASTSSVTYERAARASDVANARGLAQMQAYTRAVRENALAQRALNQARAVATANMGTAFGIGGGYLGYVAAAAGIGLLINRMGAAIDAHRKFEEHQLSTQAMLRATGNAAGQTEASLERLARSLGDDLSTSRAAVTEMLRVRSVSGATFDAAMQAAKDLAATGFGDVRTAARAVGQALGDPARGLAALEAAGIRFSHQQKTVIQDLYDTGRAAESQRATLDVIIDQIGGSGAMRAGSLNSAYTALGNALQRSGEQFGGAIVRTTRLVSVVQALATALDAINDFRLSPEVDLFLKMIVGVPLAGSVAMLARAIIPVEDPKARLREQQMREAVDIAASFEGMRRQHEGYEAVIAGIEKEHRALKQTNLEREIERRQREAQRGQMIALSQEELDDIARRVTAKDRQRKANEALAAAERAAEQARARAARQAERDAEFIRRTAVQRQAAINKLLLERDALFMTEQAARAAAIAQAELAKYRDQGIPITPDIVRDVKVNARQRAEIEQVNKALLVAKDSAADFASTLVEGFARGENMARTLESTVNNIASQLLRMGTQNLVGNLFSGLAQGRHAGGWLGEGLTSVLGLGATATGPVGAARQFPWRRSCRLRKRTAMSAINILRTKTSAIVATDAAVWCSKTGIVCAFAPKAFAIAQYPAVVAVRGAAAAPLLFGWALSCKFSTFDEMIAGLENAAPAIHNAMRPDIAHCPNFDLMIAGYSAARSSFDVYYMTTLAMDERGYVGDEPAQAIARGALNPEPYKLVAIDDPLSALPEVTEVEIIATGLGERVSGLDDESIARETLTTTTELQRAKRFAFGSAEPFHGVGGYLTLSSVTRTGVTHSVVRRWNEDRIGERITPSPVDWSAHQSKAATNVTPLNRQLRRAQARKENPS